ncbi:uncharacterized protein LOC134679119 [Cydia fagiglandana]|uniref:uncharacterized protein LOC134679119 n=1 Tax=Cydia fagiglandana TaxID=1458189 RepID=UPI002FEE4447
MRLTLNRTGNAEAVPELSTSTYKILGAIGTECATGIGVEQETGIGSGIVDSGATEFSLEAGGSQQLQADHIDHAEVVVVTPSLPTRPRFRRPRPNIAPTTRRRPQHHQQHSAAFVAAQRETNIILRDIANEIRGTARRERRRIIGPLHQLKF